MLMMDKYEYIKFYFRTSDKEMPAVFFYEVDRDNERYAARMAEVYSDRTVKPIVEEGFEFITEAPVGTVEEINEEDVDFFAQRISKEEFEDVYHSKKYFGNIDFPRR